MSRRYDTQDVVGFTVISFFAGVMIMLITWLVVDMCRVSKGYMETNGQYYKLTRIYKPTHQFQEVNNVKTNE